MMNDIKKLGLCIAILISTGCQTITQTTYNDQAGYIKQTSFTSYYTLNRYSYYNYPFAQNYFYHYGAYGRHPSLYNNCLQANRLYWYCY